MRKLIKWDIKHKYTENVKFSFLRANERANDKTVIKQIMYETSFIIVVTI